MRELVVGLVLAVGVEVEDALDEVLVQHFWVLLQQQVEKAVFTQTGAGNRVCLGLILWYISLGALITIRSKLWVFVHEIEKMCARCDV